METALKIAAAILGAGLWVGGRAHAQEPIIASFQDGFVSWSNIDSNLFYTVEYLPNLKGSNHWDGSYRTSQDIQSSDDTITVPVGVFYRVVGSSNPMHTSTSAIDSTARDAASNAQTTATWASNRANAAYGLAWHIGDVVTNAQDATARAGVAINAANITILTTGKLDVATAATTYQPVGSYLTEEADTLASIAVRGGFAGNETIAPFRSTARWYGLNAGDGIVGEVSGAYGLGGSVATNAFFQWGTAVGNFAAANSSGTYNFAAGWGPLNTSTGGHNIAVGHWSGAYMMGSSNILFGLYAGRESMGDRNAFIGHAPGYAASGFMVSAFGFNAASRSSYTNSLILGQFAGRYGAGVNQIVIDVFDTSPDDDTYGPTNTVIFAQDGHLSLGRGGALAVGKTNMLRGTWGVDSITLGTNAAVSNWPQSIVAIQTAYPLTCAPTVTVTKADIQAAPGGELRLMLTCTVQKFTFQMDTFDPYDAGSWTIAITTGSNTITADTNTILRWDSIVWTNSMTVPNDISFRKVSGVTNAVKVIGTM
jgi:hypothetical protein